MDEFIIKQIVFEIIESIESSNVTYTLDAILDFMKNKYNEIRCLVNDKAFICSHENIYYESLNNLIEIYGEDVFILIEDILEFIDEYVRENPLLFSNPYFHEYIDDVVREHLLLLLDGNELDDDNIIDSIIHYTQELYFKQAHPMRHYEKSFIRKKPNKMIIKKKIDYLQNIPQPEQRTEEWYQFRYNLITASNAWKAFGTDSVKNQLIFEKCSPMNVGKYTSYVNTESTLHWGQKFEALSVMIYEKKNNTKIKDFGCIQHNKYSFLGASPDGINVDEESPLYGRMLEIKNIVNREITGNPKEEYWIQTQLQMEVCNLNECDFLETRFTEYEDEESFLSDSFEERSKLYLTKDNKLKGIIMYFMREDKPFYEYAPLFASQEEFTIWEELVFERNNNITWMKNIYWKLDEYNCALILRNKFWFKNGIKEIEKLWNIIVREREEGYEHRAPKRKIQKITKSDEVEGQSIKNICFINTNSLDMGIDMDID